MNRCLEVFFNCSTTITGKIKKSQTIRKSMQKVTSLKERDIETIFCSGIWVLREIVLIFSVFLFFFFIYLNLRLQKQLYNTGHQALLLPFLSFANDYSFKKDRNETTSPCISFSYTFYCFLLSHTQPEVKKTLVLFIQLEFKFQR